MEFIAEILQTLWKYLLTMRVADIIDIAIIAYLVYRLILLVRRTSSEQVIKGIVVLVAALWLSSIFGLNVLNFIIGRTVELGFLALVIVFQPELRRLLEQMGSRSWGNLFSREESASLEGVITRTVTACAELSASRTGALIVFERNIRLDDALRTGTILNAEVSAELLKNIFFVKAPLHDGAVIIREGRLAGAGCVLPLSNNTNLSRDLGMRHRAGIGMSEHSDAVVAIVSEETGAISVAVGGMLKRHLAPETLEKLLRKELIAPEKETTRKKGFDFFGLFRAKKDGKADG
ncbi:diadenylate cyclase CdaA [Papillibacter cinnamivorans]|uniref:Diadenylate cyclase n=1 Tax=Papillibacter cinnamivorans DSM 12816 TaxID=1122930 RepID=A0A1W1YWP7_9FIRM|nr:diadenylate cyclase CdaA [Papillibacter cinnamivorans]SMC40128.1 diadenylate cyclase [Papillibacter cinnamivorans DSM 12816]